MEERVYGGRYRVTEQIGSGGMADVYKAVDQVLGRTVAIKVLHPRYAADPTFVARFRQEAQAAGNLSNPHIVNIYDWGQEDSTYYIVMEWVRGTDLKSLIDTRGPVDPVKAAEYAAQVCSALAVAHGYDVVHRDIKPHNIVLMHDGTVKVMDFGIARAGNTTMTQTGSVLGTAQYISPEQAQGRPIGPASDLYSLGVVLYELTTGRLPFEGDTPVAVALKQVNEQPVPPRQLEPSIPPALEAVILRAMQKDPSVRYTSAEEMRDDLRRVISGQPVAAPPHASETSVLPVVGGGETTVMRRTGAAPVRTEPRRRNYTWAWVLAIIALALIGGLLAWAAFMQPKNVQVPTVAGRTLEEASATIAASGLKVGQVTQENSTAVGSGLVIRTSPSERTPLPEGSQVDLVVSSGVAQEAIPDLRGMTRSEAIAAIQQAGFKIGDIAEKYNRAKLETVYEQSPEPDSRQPLGTAVNITVSLGVKQATVPEVVGRTEAQARSRIEDAGLKVKVRNRASNDVPKGQVIDSDPSAGTEVPAGSTVTLVVSSGPELVQVPQVVGDALADAQAKLEAKGFVVATEPRQVDSADKHDKIVDQSPSAGANAPKNSTVRIWVGVFEPPPQP